MRVEVDQVWATPSTLHMRVIVYGPENRWRHKYTCAVPLADIPEEAIVTMLQHFMDQVPEEDHHQTALF